MKKLILKLTQFRITTPLIIILFIADSLASKYKLGIVQDTTPALIFLLFFVVASRIFRIFQSKGRKSSRLLLIGSIISFYFMIIFISLMPEGSDSLPQEILGNFIMIILLVSFFVIIIYIFAFAKKNFRSTVKVSLKMFSLKTLIILNTVVVIVGGIYLFKYFQKIDERIVNIENKFGGSEKVICTDEETKNQLSKNVFRIIGSYGEGSGFPVSTERIITSFHVIEGEPSPKVVFPDGTIETPKDIKAVKHKDFAILTVNKKLSPPELFFFDNTKSFGGLMIGEPLYAFGYPLGSTIKGDPAVIKGSFSGTRWLPQVNMNVVETNIVIVKGMSGGPLTDSCGMIVGINTLGVGGFSMFLNINDALGATSDLSDEPIAKIEIDTSTSTGLVEAFYTYIKARNLEKAFELLSSERKSTVSSFEDWTRGYANTLQVNLIITEVDEEDENLVKVKIESQDWVEGEMVYKYFEGTWEVIEEGSDLRLNESNIKQVENPEHWWFYVWEKPEWLD